VSSAARRHRRRQQNQQAQRRSTCASPSVVTVTIAVPAGILPWERELLLPHVEALLTAVLEDMAQNGDED
jgi:hypothetical protein